MSAIAKINVAALADRAKNILMTPEKEWEKIDGEKPVLAELFTNYAAILIAIPAVCSFIGWQVFGIMGMHPSIGISLKHLVLTYIVSVISLVVSGLASEFLAPQFGGTADRLSAFKLAIYSMTAAWLAGIFSIVPALGILGIVGLYSVYLYYLGAPRLMKVPKEKAGVYTAAVIISTIVVGGVLGVLLLRS